VLGADRAAARGGKPQHRLVDGVVVGVGAEHVDVDVAVAEVAEDDRHRTRSDTLDDRPEVLDEPRQLAQRHPDVHLVRYPGRVERLGVALAQAPQALALAALVGHDGVLDARPVERRHQLVGRIAVTGALEQQVRRRAARERERRAEVVEDELDALVGHELGGVQRGQGGTDPGQQRGDLGDRAKGDEGRHARGQQRHEPPADAGDDAERALAADEQRRQVVARVVFQEPRAAVDDRAVGEHRLQPRDPRADGAVADRLDAARVGRDHAADRGRVATAEIHAGVEAGGACVGLERREGDSGTDGDLRGCPVDLAQLAQAPEAEHDLPVAGHPATDHPGVAALRHHGRAVLAAGRDNRRDLRGAPGPHDGARPPVEPARPVGLVRGADVVVDEHVALADRGDERVDQRHA
jgi:hypothetical protein